MTPKFHPLTIKDVRFETNDAVSLSFHLPPELSMAYAFEAGQYLTLRNTIHGDDLRRSYSICSSPLEGELRVAIKQVEGGLFSTYANSHYKAGDQLQVMTPQGRFTTKIDKNNHKNYVMIAIGSGITPIISLIKTILRTEANSKITLIYGNKTTQTIMFREELEDLKNKFIEQFAIHHVLSREISDFALLSGRLTAQKIETLTKATFPSQEIHEVFVCGAQELVNMAKQVLKSKVLQFEFFTAAEGKRGVAKPKTDAANDITLTLKYEGNAHLIAMSKDDTVLDAATRHGLDLPFSCKGGMCCTCRAHVSEGEVAMDVNYSLEPWEIERGFTLACQAKAKTAEITIDFDRQ